MSEQNAYPLDRFRGTLDYELANAEMDFTDSLETLMQRRGINKSELARRIETSPAYITKILRGSTNFTLETMVKLVRALDGELHVRACAKEDQARWFHAIRTDAIYASHTACMPKQSKRTLYLHIPPIVNTHSGRT